MLKRKLAPVFYVLPALLLLTVFIYYPIVRNLGYGFTNWNLMSNVKEWVGLENYVKLFHAADFQKAMLNNLRYVVISLIFQVGVALIFAAMHLVEY